MTVRYDQVHGQIGSTSATTSHALSLTAEEASNVFGLIHLQPWVGALGAWVWPPRQNGSEASVTVF